MVDLMLYKTPLLLRRTVYSRSTVRLKRNLFISGQTGCNPTNEHGCSIHFGSVLNGRIAAQKAVADSSFSVRQMMAGEQELQLLGHHNTLHNLLGQSFGCRYKVDQRATATLKEKDRMGPECSNVSYTASQMKQQMQVEGDSCFPIERLGVTGKHV